MSGDSRQQVYRTPHGTQVNPPPYPGPVNIPAQGAVISVQLCSPAPHEPYSPEPYEPNPAPSAPPFPVFNRRQHPVGSAPRTDPRRTELAPPPATRRTEPAPPPRTDPRRTELVPPPATRRTEPAPPPATRRTEPAPPPATTPLATAPPPTAPSIPGQVACSICYTAELGPEEQEIVFSSGCRRWHRKRNVCDDCIRQHIQAQVTGMGNSTCIRCPQGGCESVMRHGDIQRWASASVFERYDTMMLRQTLRDQTFPDFRWCAHPGCGSGHIHAGGADAPIIHCRKCEGRTCFTHRCVWHEGRTCEEYDVDARVSEEVKQLKALEVRAGLKQCPSCEVRIEKNLGCDHMTCTGCGHEFCWLCFAPYAGPDGIRIVGNGAHKPSCRHHR